MTKAKKLIYFKYLILNTGSFDYSREWEVSKIKQKVNKLLNKRGSNEISYVAA